jgi:membrane protein implicated in regulation of membrane protease activity
MSGDGDPPPDGPQPRRRSALPRYLLFQVPGWLVVGGGLWLVARWGHLAPAWAAALFALWLVKDLVLYPALRRAYEPDGDRPGGGPLAAEGVAEDPLGEHEGWVRLGPERWRARRAPGSPPIPRGAPVRVVGVHGMTVRVEPARGPSTRGA